MRLLFKPMNSFVSVRIFTTLAGGMMLFLSIVSRAAEPVSSPEQLPRIAPTEVAQIMSPFEVRDGFAMDLVASEPLVVDPVAMDFDAWGRAFVVEMRGYSERRPEKLGRIKMLKDSDRDGTFDHSVVYARDLPWPTAVVCYDGGIFVGATPDIFYFKDTDGDGSADIRQLVYTGFASASAPYRIDQLNMQAMLNSFHWGPDNRIHGATGLAGGNVYSPLRPDQPPLNLRGKDFSFDPRTLDIRTESGGAQNGMSFDSRGNKFVCSNSDHLQYIAYDNAFAGVNPLVKPKSARISIAEDGPAAPVFRISPDEPWRIVRTKWRVAGAVRGPVEGGGTPSGYFTGATGATIFTGDAWGPQYLDQAFIADCGSNLIHRKAIFPKGHVVTARRPPEESGIEFVRSSDNWFRPVQFSNGPDGNLYVLDMYREVIEHPWSLPQGIKQFLDLNSGNDRGRIYRIRRDSNEPNQRKMPGEAHDLEYMKMLGHSNHWHRETARRLMIERRMLHLEGNVRDLLFHSNKIASQINAIQVLSGLGVLSSRDVEMVFETKSSPVHLAILKLWSYRDDLGQFAAAFKSHVPKLIQNEVTRLQTVLLLSRFPLDPAEQVDLLWDAMSIEKRDKGWMQFAVLNAMHHCSSDFLKRMISEGEVGGSLFGDVNEFYQLMGRSGSPQDINQAFQFLTASSITAETMDALSSLSQGLGQTGNGWSSVLSDEDIEQTRTRYSDWMENQALANPSVGGKVIKVLSPMIGKELKQSWRTKLSRSEWAILHPGLIESLAPVLSTDDLEWIRQQWPKWGPFTRQVAFSVFFSRAELLIAYLHSAENQKSFLSDLTFPQKRSLKNHRSKNVRELATRLLGGSEDNAGDMSAEDYQDALLLDADLENGQLIFNERCASCHRANGEGFALGPDLVSVKTSGKNRILDSILFPNREIQPQYVSYEVETNKGEGVVGLIAEETSAALTVKLAGGITQTIQRGEVAAITGTGKSMMPEGLLAGLSQQDVGDLLEYIVRAER